MKKAPAYWISPAGKILSVQVGKRHIDFIIQNPEQFGLTREEVEERYARHQEAMGREGTAREELILTSIKNGWIRIRRYAHPDHWKINVLQLNENTRDILASWASGMMTQGASRYDDIRIDTPGGTSQVTMEALSTTWKGKGA